MIVYDTHFNLNEWFIVLGLCIEVVTLILIPKRFSKKVVLIFLLCGIFSGFFFDHTLSVLPVNFYDVNDNSSYQVFDFLSYIPYGLMSYLFFYFYDLLKPKSIQFYILSWAVFSFGLEWLSFMVGVFHYKKGYSMFFSFPIYLFVFNCWILFYNRFYLLHKKIN